MRWVWTDCLAAACVKGRRVAFPARKMDGTARGVAAGCLCVCVCVCVCARACVVMAVEVAVAVAVVVCWVGGGGGGVVSWEPARRGFFVKVQSNVLRSELAPCLPV